jgi:hypothetical protein
VESLGDSENANKQTNSSFSSQVESLGSRENATKQILRTCAVNAGERETPEGSIALAGKLAIASRLA